MADTTTTSTKDSSGLTIVLSILGGVIVGALAVWGWYSLGTETREEDISQVPSVSNSTNNLGEPVAPQVPGAPQAPAAPSSSTSGAAPQTGAPVSLSIPDQAAGLEVSLSSVSLPYSGWVVIHEDRAGELGNALGASRVGSDRTPTSVTLLRGTVPGGVYYGLLYRDSGDSAFSLANDFPILDASGNAVMVRFETN